jgi:hypothetical protein
MEKVLQKIEAEMRKETTSNPSYFFHPSLKCGQNNLWIESVDRLHDLEHRTRAAIMIVLYIYRSLYGIRANMEKELNHDRRQQVFAGVFQHSMERTVCVCVCVCVCVLFFFFLFPRALTNSWVWTPNITSLLHTGTACLPTFISPFLDMFTHTHNHRQTHTHTHTYTNWNCISYF